MIMKENIKTPWLSSYGEVPFYLEYPEGTMCDAVEAAADKYSKEDALAFMGRHIPYIELVSKIDAVARAFKAYGIEEGQKVTICMPNIPQTVYCLYALNKIGAIASIIHPLSAVGEIEFYLKEVGSCCVVTIDQFYDRFAEVRKSLNIEKLIVASISDELSAVKAVVYRNMTERKFTKPDYNENTKKWNSFVNEGRLFNGNVTAKKDGKDPAVILFSGGTTGVTKGILLSNYNFNALAVQTAVMCNVDISKKRMLAAMPMFHGFGLGVCIHTMLVAGGCSVLVPKFNAQSYAELIKKEKPNFIAGVPTLFEAISRSDYLNGADLSHLMGVFSGGDSLSIELKKKFDKFLKEHNASVRIREGYGTTECVTACCLTPYHIEKEGSIGLPYPDTYFKICKTGTKEEAPYGTDGEICLCGPTVMIEYINHPEETADTLQVHEDGNLWLHTGDLGYMDEEGFIYFKQRIKRMIITSGYNVYPSQLENIIDAHEAVVMSCVIGVKDDYKVQKVKAYVILKDGYKPDDSTKLSILEHCKKHIAKYAMPYDIEFRESLPKTLVGKVAYTVLEKEANENL